MKQGKKSWLGKIKAYRLDVLGSIAALGAIAMPVMVGAVGLTLDMSAAYLVRERLGGALDAAALAATSAETEQAAVRSRVEEFFDYNYPEEEVGFTYDLEVEFEEDDVIVSAYADYDTTFMRILGINDLTVYREVRVHREVRNLEVVMVLDNTGSMGTNNNIGTLRTASTNFVNILFDAAQEATDIKIGMVPYASAVNIGPYGVGQTPTGESYGGGDVFVVDEDGDPIDIDRYARRDDYTGDTNARRWHTDNWAGCVLTVEPTGGWDEDYRWNDPHPADTDDSASEWQIYEYGWYSNCRNGNDIGCNWNVSSYPNSRCPRTTIVPLTSNRNKLLNSIDTMQANGNTYSNIGMTWGYRLLTPGKPFDEAAGFDEVEWRKVAIVMTDGVNVPHSHYSAYWRSHNTDGVNTSDLNDRFEETCTIMKDQDILIYAITFDDGVNQDTKDIYKRCATTPSQYYDAPNQTELIEVFEKISRELANLHISQ